MTRAPCVVITYPHSLGAGGGGTVGCIEIARHLKQRGADVIVVPVMTMSRDRRLFRNPPLAPEYRGEEQEALLTAEGVEVVNVAPSPVHWYVDAVPTKRAVMRIVEERPVDAVLGWHHELALLPRALRKHDLVTGLFVSGWYRDYGAIRKAVPDLRNRTHLWIQRTLLQMSLKHVNVVMAISEFTKAEVCGALDIQPDIVQVAHWGVDPVFNYDKRTEPESIERFLFFGSAAIRKGGFETLEAFGRVAAEGHRDWHLKLVWTRRDELEAAARKHGIAEQVTILDPMDHEGLARELQWAQVAILPSTFESFGLACAEAQTSGVPVIAYDVGGVSEVIDDGVTGWLVENERPDLLPGAIVEAMRDPEQTYRMGLRGRERITSLYAWDRTAETILERLLRDRAAKLANAVDPARV